MTPSEILSRALHLANGDPLKALEMVCHDTAILMEEIAEMEARITKMERTPFNRRANFSVRAPKPRPKAIDE